VCGYDVTDVDWHRAGYRCPECGEINIPGDLRVAPLSPRPWPPLALSLLLMCWPGLSTGVLIGLNAFLDPYWALLPGIFGVLLGGVLCLTWPWAASEILMYSRVFEQGRRRYMPWMPVGGMVANVMLAWGVARVMFLLA
jgi:hypothetical protein